MPVCQWHYIELAELYSAKRLYKQNNKIKKLVVLFNGSSPSFRQAIIKTNVTCFDNTDL